MVLYDCILWAWPSPTFFFNGKSNEIYKYNKLKKCEGHLGKIDDNNKL